MVEGNENQLPVFNKASWSKRESRKKIKEKNVVVLLCSSLSAIVVGNLEMHPLTIWNDTKGD